MKLTKLLALILASLLCISCLASCLGTDTDPDDMNIDEENQEDNENEDDEDEDSSNADLDFLPDGDYDGEAFTILNISQPGIGNIDFYGGNYLDADSSSSSIVEEAVYERNKSVEEKYNVTINELIIDNKDPAAFLTEANLSDDWSFDLIYGWGAKMAPCIVYGHFVNISELPNIDMSQDYWSSAATDELSVNGKLYIFTNDITMNEQAWANCVFFNDTVAKKYGVYEELGVDNFYDMVNDGNWTLDAFLTAIQLVSDDVNDSGVIDTDEVWGITDISGTGEVYGFGAGVTLATAEHTGYSLNYYTDTSAGIAKDIYEIMSNSSYTKNITDFQYDTFASYAAIGSGHSLFMTGAPFLAEMIGDSDNSLGILPLPKYDNNQNEYICSVDCLASVFAVPAKSNMSVSTAGPERTGVILESMAYISSYQLLPKYREVTAALINDEDTENIIDMLKLMKSSAHYDLIYMLGSMDIWGGGLGTITSSYSAMFTSPNAAGSTYRRNTLKMETALDEFFNSVMSLEG